MSSVCSDRPPANFPTFAKWLKHFRISPRRNWRMTSYMPRDSTAGQQAAFLRMLAVGAEQRLPWAPLVANWANDHSGRRRRMLFRLARRLKEGTPLADALEQTPGALSLEGTLAVRFGAQSGTLAATLNALVERNRVADHQIAARWRRLVGYFVAVAVIGSGIAFFITEMIFPFLLMISEDWQLEPPAPLVLWLDVYYFVMNYGLLLPVILFAVGMLFYSHRVQQYVRRRWLPRLSRSAARLGVAYLLDMLATAVRKGRPLHATVSTLARYHYDSRIRQQLLYVRNEVEQGADIWSTTRQCGLLDEAEVDAIRHTTTSASLAWTIEQLAATRRQRVAERLETQLDLLHPAMVLVLALFVMLLALATLLPLIKLTGG